MKPRNVRMSKKGMVKYRLIWTCCDVAMDTKHEDARKCTLCAKVMTAAVVLARASEDDGRYFVICIKF